MPDDVATLEAERSKLLEEAEQALPVVFQKGVWHPPCWKPKWRREQTSHKAPLMVLKTLDALGPLQGYGFARRIEQISGDLLAVNQGLSIPFY
jgi:hypothetical protein